MGEERYRMEEGKEGPCGILVLGKRCLCKRECVCASVCVCVYDRTLWWAPHCYGKKPRPISSVRDCCTSGSVHTICVFCPSSPFLILAPLHRWFLPPGTPSLLSLMVRIVSSLQRASSNVPCTSILPPIVLPAPYCAPPFACCPLCLSYLGSSLKPRSRWDGLMPLCSKYSPVLNKALKLGWVKVSCSWLPVGPPKLIGEPLRDPWLSFFFEAGGLGLSP